MKFSIITVSYNSQKTIERTIKSILSQSFKDFEYIIIDGASTDRTMDVVKFYETRFEGRLRYFSEPDKGIYDAMNKGIRMSKGDIIGIVNSDDWLDENALETIYEASREIVDENVVFTGDIVYHYNDGSEQTISFSPNKLKRHAREYRMGVNHPATFVPKRIYEKYGLYDLNIRYQADCDFINRIYHSGVSFVFVDKIISNMSDGGASTTGSVQSLKDYRYILKKNLSCRIMQEILYLKYYVYFQIKKYSPLWLIKTHRK